LSRLAGEKIYDVVSIRTMDVITEKYMVDLNKMECTCRRWMLTGIPCCHALCCYIDRKEDPTTVIPIIYRKETYKDVYSQLFTQPVVKTCGLKQTLLIYYHHH
jgi:hypothetical protein